MHRLFFALWPDATLRDAIGQVAAGHPALRAARRRVVRPEQYHLTLQFLGDFDVLTPQLRGALALAATGVAAVAPFELVLDCIGSFHAGRVAWMGCRTPPAALIQLHERLGNALEATGVPPKSTPHFVPHLTLRRNARGQVEESVPPLSWPVRDFVLVDSTAGEYRILGRWLLAPA